MTESPNLRQTTLAAVHVLLLRHQAGRWTGDGAPKEVLLIRRHNTGYEDGKWSLPAGHIDSGETATAAAVREAREEVGVTIRHLRVAHVMHRQERPGRERVDFFMAVWQWKGKPRVCEPEKCSEVRWVDPGRLPADVIPYIQHAVGAFVEGISYSEYGW